MIDGVVKLIEIRLTSSEAEICLSHVNRLDDVVTNSIGPLIKLWRNALARKAKDLNISRGQVWLRLITLCNGKTAITETPLRSGLTATACYAVFFGLRLNHVKHTLPRYYGT
jgi:hypothetical protein